MFPWTPLVVFLLLANSSFKLSLCSRQLLGILLALWCVFPRYSVHKTISFLTFPHLPFLLLFPANITTMPFIIIATSGKIDRPHLLSWMETGPEPIFERCISVIHSRSTVWSDLFHTEGRSGIVLRAVRNCRWVVYSELDLEFSRYCSPTCSLWNKASTSPGSFEKTKGLGFSPVFISKTWDIIGAGFLGLPVPHDTET